MENRLRRRLAEVPFPPLIRAERPGGVGGTGSAREVPELVGGMLRVALLISATARPR
jgi:hypothetical protein